VVSYRRGVLCGVLALVAASVVVVWPRGAASAVGRFGAGRTPGLVLGSQFALAAGTQGGDYDAAALGSDGTVWLAQLSGGETAAAGFAVVARAAHGHPVRLAFVSTLGFPAVAVSGAAAMFVWSGGDVSTQQAEVRAMRCTLSGCGPVQVLASWLGVALPPDKVDFTGYPPLPSVVGVDGQFVTAFAAGASPTMEWAQTAGATFGAAHSFGVAGQPYPVLVQESGGKVMAAWLDGYDHSWIEWSQWTASDGFSPPSVLRGAAGLAAADLVAAPSGHGAALAWIQGDGPATPGQYTDPVWVALSNAAGGLSKPTRAYSRPTGQLSLAGNDGVLALAFNKTTAPGGYADDGRGAMVERSIDGAPFGSPVDVDPHAGAHPAVAVDRRGDVLAAWNRQSSGGNYDAKLAIAAASGPFRRPVTLGSELISDSPLTQTNASGTLITWQQQPDTLGVIATP
jgi:hypothetical protein